MAAHVTLRFQNALLSNGSHTTSLMTFRRAATLVFSPHPELPFEPPSKVAEYTAMLPISWPAGYHVTSMSIQSMHLDGILSRADGVFVSTFSSKQEPHAWLSLGLHYDDLRCTDGLRENEDRHRRTGAEWRDANDWTLC